MSVTVRKEQLLTATDVARMLGITEQNVYVRARQGLLHPIRDGRYLTFHPHDVENEIQRVLEARKRSPGVIRGLKEKSAQSGPPGPDSRHPLNKQHYLEPFSGEDCSKAVKLFQEGKQVLDVVVELNLKFDIAKYFWQQFLELRPSFVITKSANKTKLRVLFEYEEEPFNEDNFVAALQNKLANMGVKAKEEKDLSPEEKASLEQLDKELAASQKKP